MLVNRFGDPWSTWRWIGSTPDRQLKPGAYFDLQEPWRQTSIGWDTIDLTLDVLVDADGNVSVKDVDELAWSQQVGVYPDPTAARIREIGRQAFDHAASADWPLRPPLLS